MEAIGLIILLLSPIAFSVLTASMFETPLWIRRALGRVELRALKTFRSDRPAVGYVALHFKNGVFRDSTRSEDIFGESDLIAYKSIDDALKHAGKYRYSFLAETLLFGEVQESSANYRSKSHRVLQVVSLRAPVRSFIPRGKSLEVFLQPTIDTLQERSGSLQPVRHVDKIEEFEPTTIAPSDRALRRAQRVGYYYTPFKRFYAEDNLTVAPGLYPVGIVRGTERPKRLKGSILQDLMATLQDRISETSGRRLQKTLKILLGQLTELSSRASAEEFTEQSLRLIEAKRATSIQRLLELSSRDYYGNFLRSPERWSNPERMTLQVELSAIALSKELAEDLRLLNSPRELDFQLNVLSLVGRATEARGGGLRAEAVSGVLQIDTAEEPDLQGDLESLRAAVAAEEIALLEAQRKQKVS